MLLVEIRSIEIGIGRRLGVAGLWTVLLNQRNQALFSIGTVLGSNESFPAPEKDLGLQISASHLVYQLPTGTDGSAFCPRLSFLSPRAGGLREVKGP
jgi:hypothetical protein